MRPISLRIEELALPATVDAPGAADFVEMIDVRNRVEVGILGTDALSVTPAAVLPHFGSNPERGRRHFVARADGAIVGRAILGWPTAAGAVQARVNVDVLPEHRGVGVGSALLETVESVAAGLSRYVLQCDQPHGPRPGGGRIASPTGWGDLPADDVGVRFALRHGYELEMVARISQLNPGATVESARGHLQTAQEHAGSDYRLVTWRGPTPDDRLDDMAALRSGMSTDAPMAGMEVAPDPWDAERVRAHGVRQLATGRILLTAAAEHVPSGRFVAYTEIEVDPGDAPAAVQEGTLVLRSHRGNRLGMLLKAANILHLLDVSPSVRVLTTFNAEENRSMLDVNEALGFIAIAYEGNWQKRVASGEQSGR